MLEVTAVIQ